MEKAKALKMKMEALKRQGARTDLTSPKISAKFRSDDEIGAGMGMSGDTVRSMISLTQLVPEFQQMVDEKKRHDTRLSDRRPKARGTSPFG